MADKQKANGADETKEDKFRRLGVKRFSRAAERIRMISNLSNRSIYDYTEEQVEEILSRLRGEVDMVQNSFDAAGKKKPDIELAI